MARVFPTSASNEDRSDPGEWSALRGELVALLDQVEGHYSQPDAGGRDFGGLADRVRELRGQVTETPATRHREALRSVKKAVDRFSDRDEPAGEHDELRAAIAEIRGRQGIQVNAAGASMGRRVSDNQPLADLSGLVGGLSGRLERLEAELRGQRSNSHHVRDIAAQVEQLSHVVELLAGAVGETGQVKRLEAQMNGLARLIESSGKPDLSAVNSRLDELASTVSKLAELQVQQMEREIVREEQPVRTAPEIEQSLHSIEAGLRNVYDRIDTIERTTGLSHGDLERVTSDLGRIAGLVESSASDPAELARMIDNLAAKIDRIEAGNADLGGLKIDLEALRDTVVGAFEPRFVAIEGKIGDLSARVTQASETPPAISAIEAQLERLHERLDATGRQLDSLSRLAAEPVAHAPMDEDEIDAIAERVARHTTSSLAQHAPGPVIDLARLEAIETRLRALAEAERTHAAPGPDLDALAERVAERTSAVLGRAVQPAKAGMDEAELAAFEQRMAALINASGEQTAERLSRLENAFSDRAALTQAEPRPTPTQTRSKQEANSLAGLDAMLAALAEPEPVSAPPARSAPPSTRDTMPEAPDSEAPLIDRGPIVPPRAAAMTDKPARRLPDSASHAAPPPELRPETIARPPAPVSSLGVASDDPFADVEPVRAEPKPTPAAASAQSTFIAAARRAQLSRQAETVPASTSLIGRALSRVMPGNKPADEPDPALDDGKLAQRTSRRGVKAKPAPIPAQAEAGEPNEVASQDAAAESEVRAGFLARNKRALLLAVALVAVSALALNLAMSRMASRTNPALEPALEQSAPAQAPEGGDLGAAGPLTPQATASTPTALVAPRVIDMIDSLSTGSVASTPRAVQAEPGAEAAMPAAIEAEAAALPTDAEDELAIVETSPVSFDLPPEGTGPLPLRQAAADGNPRAQFEIAAILTEGRAVEQDLVAAATWYERAATQDFVPAQYRLGNLYESGSGVERDLDLARHWYQRAAEAGNRMAMHNLAAIHASGELGEQEFEVAAEWFQRAAELGMTDSQFNLGMLHARGLGLEQDFEASYRWFSIAALRGDDDAVTARADVARSLDAEAVARLEAEIATWQPHPIDLVANFAPIGTWSDDFDPGETIASTDVVRRVQQALDRLGYDVGSPDGLIGPRTREAISAFERGTGMNATGAINPRLLAVLGSQPV